MNAIEKANKKAWNEIREISESTNMVGISSLLNDAILKTFGLCNLGLLKIKMDDDEKFYITKAYRYENLSKYGKEVRNYLMTFIPERLKGTIMFNEMTTK